MLDPIKQIKPLGFPWETQDPFLFCVYHADHYPKGNEKLGPDTSLQGRNIGNDFTIKDGFRMYHGTTVPGFPAHPHSGFETVTIARKGLVDHSDSLGAAGRFGHGDVQWMTAGKGVQHSEMFPLLKKDEPNDFELFQIWLNLPAINKKVNPHFAMLWNDTIPSKEHLDDTGKKSLITVMAGALDGISAPSSAPNSWAVDPNNEVGIWTIKMDSVAKWKFPAASKETNRSLYFFDGSSITIADQNITDHCVIELSADSAVEIQNGSEPCELLILQGKPIGEPVVQYGPFVQNTNEQIQQTMMDYQNTEFGGWPWPKLDHTHPPEKGRFARYADGTIETKD